MKYTLETMRMERFTTLPNIENMLETMRMEQFSTLPNKNKHGKYIGLAIIKMSICIVCVGELHISTWEFIEN